ncbi:enoyl-CoA hydratase [Scopulibacillus daqui]|uniref:Enoyl-CoA hydratase n=1 Tax=Scopulibacillus daqui TaxID=1469162 RepID=A0ABS2PUX1_9BACL|nr:enoyl-CoA hydratase-related protein [Scopulibacillus daqui]MBM7643848.1 enoyl-CoA hydratase [Scopulibacillus daqui]
MSKPSFINFWQENGIGYIELNRPKVLNALNRQMVSEIVSALAEFDHNHDIRVILIKGSGRAFAAGADIDEMAHDTPVQLELLNQFAEWDRISLIKKPVIAAVHGFALGGGFELALSCDFIFAAENARFGFPEVNLGVMPGAGGTVRLTKAMGRTKALEWLCTGEQMEASAANHYGLITRLVPEELLFEEAERFAKKLAEKPPLSLRLIKDTVNKAVDANVYEAMQYERKNFYLLFASSDQKEGMEAFVEKRPAAFRGQ